MFSHRTPDGRVWLIEPRFGESAADFFSRARRTVDSGAGHVSETSLCKSEAWTAEDGSVSTWQACRDNHETQQEFCARFDAELKEAMELFPCPDPR